MAISMISAFRVEVDASTLESIADKLAMLDGGRLNIAAVNSVNAVGHRYFDETREKTFARYNLSQAYIDDRMVFMPAMVGDKAESRVIARYRHTRLATYGGRQESTAVNWSNARIEAMGHKFSAWPGWTRRTGDKSRGIVADEKAAGVSVEITRGRRKTIKGAFLIPLRSGNGFGVFTRAGKGQRPVHRYSLSVYQIFRAQNRASAEDLQRDLRSELERQVDIMVKEVL